LEINVIGVNLTPAERASPAIQSANLPLRVCTACAAARTVEESNLIQGAVIKPMGDYIKAVAAREKNVAF
jgi:uncharacterized protein involved in oxidation of intracellular sulfur